MSPWDVLGWLLVGTCAGVLLCVLLLVFAAFALWARARAHVRAWAREPVDSTWVSRQEVYRVHVNDKRVTVTGVFGDVVEVRGMSVTEFVTMARSNSWRRTG